MDAARYGIYIYIYIDFYDTLLSENGVTNCELNLCESFYEFRKEK